MALVLLAGISIEVATFDDPEFLPINEDKWAYFSFMGGSAIPIFFFFFLFQLFYFILKKIIILLFLINFLRFLFFIF